MKLSIVLTVSWTAEKPEDVFGTKKKKEKKKNRGSFNISKLFHFLHKINTDF